MRAVAKRTAVLVVASGVATLATACGGSPSAGSTTTPLPTAQPLAFSHCMRAHGVPTFPDPNSSGVWPKDKVYLAAGNPSFASAERVCGHLLPDGGPGVSPSPSVVQLIQTDMTKFAQCMRAHGVPRWPSATLDRGRAVFDPAAAGIDVNAPKVSSEIHTCEQVFPASIGIPPGA
jgi:hypothetical protein